MEEFDQQEQTTHIMKNDTRLFTPSVAPGEGIPEHVSDLVGTRIGKLLFKRCLGRGGMGEVYLGLDESLDRHVAVKVIHGKYRMGSVGRARFKREAMILSQLEHPYICRVYDYVESEDQDLLVMEYIKGVNLKQALKNGLSFKQKLRILDQVTQVLCEAHRKQIVHRDLKPENIMLTQDNQVKVLDFGLARSADDLPETNSGGNQQPVGEGSQFQTAVGTISGTPMFMSPEQALGQKLGCSSDIFALGLVAQWLFTGVYPFKRDANHLLFLKRVSQGDVLDFKLEDSHLTNLIKRLTTPSSELRPTAHDILKRLEWIEAKPAMKKKKLLTTAVILFMSLTTLFAVTEWLRAHKALKRAEVAEVQALDSRDRAVAVKDFVQDMLKSADPWSDGSKTVTVVQVLDAARSGLDQKLSNQPHSKAEILDTLAESYLGLGKMEQAEAVVDQAIAVRQSLADGTDRVVYSQLIKVRILNQKGDPNALQLMDQIYAKIADYPLDLRLDIALVRAQCFMRLRRETEAKDHLQETMQTYEIYFEKHPDRMVQAQGLLASCLWILSEFEAAEEIQRGVVAQTGVFVGKDHPQYLMALANLATIHTDMGRFDEAERIETDLLNRYRQLLGPNHATTLDHATNLAFTLRGAKKVEQAAKLLQDTLARYEQHYGPHHPPAFTAMHQQAANYASMGDLETAVIWERKATEGRIAVFGNQHRLTLTSKHKLATSLCGLGQYPEAEGLARAAYLGKIEIRGEDHAYTLNSQFILGKILYLQGSWSLAEPMLAEVLAKREAQMGASHQAVLETAYYLALTQQKLGKAAEAQALFNRTEAGGYQEEHP